MATPIDTTRLRTIPNYAATYNDGKGVTRGYIYKLIRAKKVETVEIDGVRFILLPASDSPVSSPL